MDVREEGMEVQEETVIIMICLQPFLGGKKKKNRFSLNKSFIRVLSFNEDDVKGGVGHVRDGIHVWFEETLNPKEE